LCKISKKIGQNPKKEKNGAEKIKRRNMNQSKEETKKYVKRKK